MFTRKYSFCVATGGELSNNLRSSRFRTYLLYNGPWKFPVRRRGSQVPLARVMHKGESCHSGWQQGGFSPITNNKMRRYESLKFVFVCFLFFFYLFIHISFGKQRNREDNLLYISRPTNEIENLP